MSEFDVINEGTELNTEGFYGSEPGFQEATAAPVTEAAENAGEEYQETETETFTELYGKYSDAVRENLEGDRYFHYLYSMLNAGVNEFHQTNQILRKVVDETWLAKIEDSLDAINRIIDHPRRFIKNTEEIVPVELAKKITGESVRHLAQNTQFINLDERGDIMPTKILNVTVEETYDLYENRFIYHLIQKLVTFIDKRTDIIFWSTGDEIRHKLEYSSHIDDAYERIDYKVEMEISNLQSFAENDTENLTTFMRIDRVRRLVLSLKHSAFCDIMNGCSIVRSPIQRTNLMIKDPDYKKAYQLWQFMEQYEEQGYTINVEDNAMAFDQEYVHHMFTNMITNYAVFKSLIEVDEREVNDELQKEFTLAKQNKIIWPKFIKEIKEEIVEDRDLPDVEIRRVFVEEVTEAQLEAELAAEEARMAMEEAVAAKKVAEHETLIAKHELEDVRESLRLAEGNVQTEKEAAENARRAKEAAEAAAAAAAAAASEALAAKEEAEASEAAAWAECEERVKATNETADERIAQAEASAEERVNLANAEAEEKARIAAEEAEQRVNLANAEAEEKARQASAEAEEKVRLAAEEAEAAKATAWAECEEKVKAANETADERIAQAEASAEERVNLANAEAEEKVRLAAEEAEAAKATAWAECEEKVKAASETADERIAQAEADAKQRIDQTNAEAEEKVRLANAEAGRKVAEATDAKNALEQQLRDTEDSLMNQVKQLKAHLEAETAAKQAALTDVEALKAQKASMDKKLTKALKKIEKYQQKSVFEKWFGK